MIIHVTEQVSDTVGSGTNTRYGYTGSACFYNIKVYFNAALVFTIVHKVFYSVILYIKA